MNMLFFVFLLFFPGKAEQSPEQFSANDRQYMLREVNKLRAKGCKCGRKKMKPAAPVVWNKTLEKSALYHARDMKKNRFFSHFSSSGKDVGERLEALDYPWEVIGENIAEGQKNFKEVFHDWKESKTHCEMMMNPKVTEMGISKYDRFWVQHFGKPIPKGAVAHRYRKKR